MPKNRLKNSESEAIDPLSLLDEKPDHTPGPEDNLPHEIPLSDRVYYVDLINQKMAAADERSHRDAAILKKYFYEKKNPEQILKEIQQEFGFKFGFSPELFRDVIGDITGKVERGFGYELPHYPKTNEQRQVAQLREKLKVDSKKTPSDFIIITAEDRKLIDNMNKGLVRAKLGDLEAELFKRYWRDNASVAKLGTIMEDFGITEVNPSKVQLKMSLLMEMVLKIAKQEEHKRRYPEATKKFGIWQKIKHGLGIGHKEPPIQPMDRPISKLEPRPREEPKKYE